MVPLTVLPLVGAMRVTLGGVVDAAAAWLTVKVCPATVIVPERVLVAVLAATE